MNPLHHRTTPKPLDPETIEPRLRARLDAIFDALVILSPTSFRFAGEPPVQAPAAPAPAPWPALAGARPPSLMHLPDAHGPGAQATVPGLGWPWAQAAVPGLQWPGAQAAVPGLQWPGAQAGVPGLAGWLGALGGLQGLGPGGAALAAGAGGVLPSGGPAPVHPLATAMLWPVYMRCYTKELGAVPAAPAAPAAPIEDPAFVEQLSAKNRSQTRWDPAWRVYQLGAGGAVHVEKGGVHRLAQPGEYAFGVPGRLPAVGDLVDVLALRESRLLQMGFYHALSETVPSDFDDAHLARLYFHAKAEGVPGLIEIVSGKLNAYEIPFRMKCLTSPAGYTRADAAVLYVARRFLGGTLRALAAEEAELSRHLRPGAPLFTKELFPGVGAADEPGTGESFGQARSRLLCEGVVDAWQRGLQTREGRLEAVAARFAQVGLSLAAPHLNEGMADLYQWPQEGTGARS